MTSHALIFRRIRRGLFASSLALAFVMLAFVVLALASRADAQSIAGVVNDYARVIAFDYCENTLTIASTAPFQVGDRILVLQMTGAIIDRTNTASFGSVSSLSAGTSELATVAAVPDATHLRLVKRLVHQYDVLAGITQIVRSPALVDAVVTSDVVPTPWDPVRGIGGVVFLDVKNSLVLQASIDASSAGFVGGAASSNAGDPNVLDYAISSLSGRSASKGGGVATATSSDDAGRAPIANGGGGGNSHNSGGGGGASLTSHGGSGGDQTNEPGFGRLANGGIGGRSLLNAPAGPLLVMGGGGGGGQQNDGYGGSGGPGGGIVVIVTPFLTHNGHLIRVDGSGGATSTIDGAGGGGAAGCIYLDATQILDAAPLQVTAIGGAGGLALSSSLSTAFGPGGGGGGGAIYTTTALAISPTLDGGRAGNVAGCLDPVLEGTTYGATDGASGGAFRVMALSEGQQDFIRPRVAARTVSICEGETTGLVAEDADSYLWSPATDLDDATKAIPSLIFPVSRRYTVTMQRYGCTFVDSVDLTVTPRPHIALLGSSTACLGSTEVYTAPVYPNATYKWSVTGGTLVTTNTETATIQWNVAGPGIVTLSATQNGCESIATLNVTVDAQAVPTITGAALICDGETTTLGTTQPFASYLWSTGETTPTITVAQPGSYTVTVKSGGGCEGSSIPYQVVVNPKPSPVLSATMLVLSQPGDVTVLSLERPYASYVWSTGESSPSISVTTPGRYSVTVIDNNGCSGVAIIDIESPQTLPNLVFQIADATSAPGDHIHIPLQLLQEQNSQKLTTNDFSYVLTFNGSLLTPVEVPLSSTWSGHWRTITLRGRLPARVPLGTVRDAEFIVGLGDTLATTLHLDSIIWDTPQQGFTTWRSGAFTLAGVCPAGGNRLFSENGRILLSSITPNPVRDRATIRYSLAEPGFTELSVLDMLGRTIATVEHAEMEPGDYTAALDCTSLPAGTYLIMLRTPTDLRHTTLCVEH